MRLASVCLQALDRRVAASPSRSSSISFLGLGRMGSEMAFNLFSKRHALSDASDASFVVCDAVPEAASAFTNNFRKHFPVAQVRVVQTPEEAVLASQILITMLPSSPHVRNVYTEANGVLAGLQALQQEQVNETLCIDSTTLDVNVARQVAADVIKAGAQMVDAPVSGGVTGAKAATLSFLVGGTEDAFKLTEPILQHMGKRIIHCGASGSGLASKICNNLVLGVEQIVTAEAMLLGQRLGVKPGVLADVINSSTGACWSCSVNNPVPSALPDKSPPCERDYDGGFATALMLKDMGLASESASRTNTPLPLGAAAERIYDQVIKSAPELARKDFSSVYRYLEKMSPERH